MKKSLLEIYAYAVCFFALAMFLIFFGIAMYNVVSLTAPQFTLASAVWQQHQSDEEFENRLRTRYGRRDDYQLPEGEALTREREASLERTLQNERRSAAQNLIQNAIILLVNGTAFAFHWRLAARERNRRCEPEHGGDA